MITLWLYSKIISYSDNNNNNIITTNSNTMNNKLKTKKALNYDHTDNYNYVNAIGADY